MIYESFMISNNHHPILDTYLHTSIAEVDSISKIGAGDVTVEGCRVELGQNKYFVEATVDAVAHWDVYKPVTSSDRNLQKHTLSSHLNMKVELQESDEFYSQQV